MSDSQNKPLKSEDGGNSRAQDAFQSVGEQIDQLTLENEDGSAGCEKGNDEPKVVDEIESLCMNCGRDVRPWLDTLNDPMRKTLRQSGHHPTLVDADSLLSRDHFDVLLL